MKARPLTLRHRTRCALAALQAFFRAFTGCGESGADELFYKAANVNAAATLLQQRLGELVAATGGQIRAARVEIKPETKPVAERAGGHEPFAVNLTFATSSAGLVKLLFQLETLRPIVLVDHGFINAGPELQALQHSTNTAD
jgi:Type II secretion system (T2SS), protein M subtype b